MSREILFRGKRMDNGEWVHGYYVCRYKFLKDVFQHMIAYREFERPSNLLYAEINPETVGQFIGLYDANGNWLFEGDIIKGDQGPAYVIEYGEGIAGYLARAAEESTWTPSMNAGTMKNYRIIGNRWDNPELMGKEG